MNTPLRIVALSTLALALAACGGGEPDRGAVTQGDVSALGVALGEAWGVECGEPLVDGAGYPKVVCPIPDDMMTPGMSSNAVAIQTFTEWEQADDFEESYVTEGDGFMVRNGWFVVAPTQELADEAASELE